MKDRLRDKLNSFSALSNADIEHGLKYFTTKSVKKNNLLIEAGRKCDWIAFVISGVLRNYYISSKGEEVTYCLTFPNNFISAYSSFLSSEKTIENIHAITDSEILVITKNHYQQLIRSSENWFKYSTFLTEQSYILMEKQLLTLQMESAEYRYKDLINNRPEYIQEVPLKYLASYLGITQRHLSRLRKNISY